MATTFAQHAVFDNWIQNISAGAEALGEKDFDELGAHLNNFFRHAVNSENISSNIISTWNLIATSATGSEMLHTLSLRIEPDLYYKFAENLLGLYRTTDIQELNTAVHNYLNFLRQPAFLKNIYNQKKWEEILYQLIDKSNFHLEALFQQRLIEYGRKPLFRIIKGNVINDVSWKQSAGQILEYQKGLIALLKRTNGSYSKVAFLCENSLEMALLDLSCLTAGLVDIMIPANSVPQHIEFILQQTRAEVLIVSGDKQLAKIKSIKSKLNHLVTVVLLSGSSAEKWVISLDQMVSRGKDISNEMVEEKKSRIHVNELATLMYTSGTTGDPKGIMFSNMNLVYKRFCRAMALPDIGPDDRFLCYLPLFHTFGRYLEMLGSVFLGAQYIFMENPALETMVNNMRRVSPTVFISIPKKWYELYNYIAKHVDMEFDDAEHIRDVTHNITGGKLRWGLSAAGFLEAEVFNFFQQNNIELMSGFGMTEATGGITMTPPGRYIENSLGLPLPGIEVKLSEDGEMMIRGPYVMMGYYESDRAMASQPNGWVSTGDVMRMDEQGFFEIIDRKKEIYKNIKGETIAPQKIENYFRDMQYIEQVFLVGDHRPFNTLLIYPGHESTKIVSAMTPEERSSYYSSVVVTVNKFLAPFERIVDYRIIDRPFTLEKGELTPKNTYKRRIIENNFTDVIQTMYTENYISLTWSKMEIRVPNWFLREKGCLTGDIIADKRGIHIPKYLLSLELEKISEHEIRVGDFIFKNSRPHLDFQFLLANPLLWLGNQAIVDLAGEAIYQWYRIDSSDLFIHFDRVHADYIIPAEHIDKFDQILQEKEYSLEGLHLATLHLQSPDISRVNRAVEYLQFILADDSLPLFTLAKDIVNRPLITLNTAARQQLFICGLAHFKGEAFENYLEKYVSADALLVDDETTRHIVKQAKGDENLYAVYRVLKKQIIHLSRSVDIESTPIPSLLNLLAEYGIKHPTRYKMVRQQIVRYQLFEDVPDLVRVARRARQKLLRGFRQWLGENQIIAVDVETGEEYQWSDVITFEEDIDAADRQRILKAVTETSLVREAIFLLSAGSMIRLYDIPPGGMWISLVKRLEDKSFYRLSVQTRFQGAYDIALCVNYNHNEKKLRDEINWLIHISTTKAGENLVDNFGGYWAQFGVWSKEFVPRKPITRFLKQQLRRDNPDAFKRAYNLWPFIVWSSAWAHLRFWKRSNYTMDLVEKSPDNIICPSHDYQTGIKFVSIEKRRSCTHLKNVLTDFYNQFVVYCEQNFEVARQGSVWNYIFYALLDSEGELNGSNMLQEMMTDLGKRDALYKELNTFFKNFDVWGYLPKKIFFAIRRFERWKVLNSDAALSAQARTLNELYDTYQLMDLEKRYPGTRTNFFLHTVFADSNPELRGALLDIVKKQHSSLQAPDQMLALISGLQKTFELSEKEAFFLTRLSYPHLKPTDTAELVSGQGDSHTADVVVRLEDYEGRTYLVRRPVTPKEISRLHQIFLEAQLPVNFRPQHRFLVAISDRGNIIGGLFYSYIDDKTVYMEKIVVSNRYRRIGISEGLMNEFFNRMRSEFIETVTTGFLRPEYFYRFGFKVERKYSGLVKDLTKNDS